jgi:Family of unknown function (DUF5994)
MPSTAESPAAVGLVPPDEPRLRLQPAESGYALLDGAWWPRSADPAAELPGLIPALDARHGRIVRLMLGTAGWDDSKPHRISAGSPGRAVKVGWFTTMPAGLLTAFSATGERTDLVTIPPQTAEPAASAAMQQAAEAGNREHAPAILAAITGASPRQP